MANDDDTKLDFGRSNRDTRLASSEETGIVFKVDDSRRRSGVVAWMAKKGLEGRRKRKRGIGDLRSMK